MLEDVTIVEIMTRDGVACGAIGINIYSGEIILIEAKAVVIGTGGYQPFSMKNTVSDMTGDGPAMAYRAGAKLTDMEFMLAFPTAVVPQDMKGSIYPFIFEMQMPNLRFVVKDRFGNPLPIPQEIIDLTRRTKLSKLVSHYYMGRAIDDGLGGPNGGVFWDYSGCTQEEKDKSFETLYGTFVGLYRPGHYKGESLKRVQDMINNNKPLEVGLGFEYCMGGIVINGKMETSVPGLFAAGEATSGVFGACRAGDGLVEMLCQGMRAGYTAAQYCLKNARQEIARTQVEQHMAKIMGYFDNQGGMNPVQICEQIEKAGDAGFGLIRTEESLSRALSLIVGLKKQLESATITYRGRAYNIEWLKAMQAENLLTCCEAGIRAALARKESRGCHIRRDYPEVDHDNYVVKYVFSRNGDEMEMQTRKPVVTRIEPPTGRRNSVIEYFLDKSLNYKR